MGFILKEKQLFEERGSLVANSFPKNIPRLRSLREKGDDSIEKRGGGAKSSNAEVRK